MNRIVSGGGFPAVVYDLATGTVVHELTDFALHLCDDEDLNQTTVKAIVNHLLRFGNYVLSKAHRTRARSLLEAVVGISDAGLKAFRDDDLLVVKSNPRSRQSDRKAKATINARLAAVYRWIWWLQCSAYLPPRVAGPFGCALTVAERDARVGKRADGRVRLKMPLLFRDAERRSKHKTGFVATRDTADKAVEVLMSRPSSEYRNLRDALIVDLAVEVGLRVGSIASLLVTDFDRRAIEGTSELTFLVTPRVQKFSYQNSFDVPVWLALRVCALIDVRDDYLGSKGVGKSVAQQSIFLSERRCTPLRPRSISQLISGVLRSLGAPKGTSIHTFRGLFCTEEIERDIDYRIRSGLDTSTASISAAVSLKMGQRDPMSIFPYVSRALSLRAARDRARVRSA